MKKIFYYSLLIVLFGGVCQAQTIYQTDQNGIIATNLEVGKSTQLMHPVMDYPGGLWVDTNNNQLFWADLFTQSIMTASTDSSAADMRAIANPIDQNLGWPTDVLVNPDTEIIYFTMREGSEFEMENAVVSMNYQGEILDTLLNEDDGLDRPSALTADKVNNILYVADSDEGIFRVSPTNKDIAGPLSYDTDRARGIALDQQNAKLYVITTDDELHKMNTDGSQVEVLVDSGFVEGEKVKLDLDEGKVYWTSGGDSYEDIPGKIQRANLDGSEVEEVFSSEEYAFNGLFLDPANDEMYVISRGPAAIMKMNMDGTNVSEIYNENNSGIRSAGTMAYNSTADELIWTQDGGFNYDAPHYVLKSAADGSGTPEVLFSSQDEINSIEIDEENGRLFWGISEGYEAQLYVGNLDGSNPKILTEYSASGTTRIRDIEYKTSTDEVFWIVDGREWMQGVYRKEVEADTSFRINEEAYLTDLAYSPSNDSLYVYGYEKIVRMGSDGSGVQDVIVDRSRPGDLQIYEDRIYWGHRGGLFSADLAGNDSMMVSSQGVDLNRGFVFGPELTFTNTDEKSTNSTIPQQISLKQNYPNPFNPSTNIQFSIPQTTQISLKVYNMLGQEVATIFEGRMRSGHHNLKFDAAHLASGVYLYRLQAGKVSTTKKFTLIK